MLRLLTPDQVALFWTDIREALRYSVIPLAEATDASLNSILETILTGGMQVWVALGKVEEQERPIALAVTYINKDIGTGTKKLVIYALCGYHFIEEGVWREGLEVLRKFARAEGCTGIVGYTKVPRVVEVAKMLGGKVEYSFIELEV